MGVSDSDMGLRVTDSLPIWPPNARWLPNQEGRKIQDGRNERKRKYIEEVSEDEIQHGDLIQLVRALGLYAHWAVYIGNGKVIHLSPPVTKGSQKAVANELLWLSIGGLKSSSFGGISMGDILVRTDNLTDVAGDSAILVNNEFDPPRKDSYKPYPKEEIVKRAKAKLGTNSYNVFTYNCEHFATECRYGVARSKQVHDIFGYIDDDSVRLVALPGRAVIPAGSLPVGIVSAHM